MFCLSTSWIVEERREILFQELQLHLVVQLHLEQVKLVFMLVNLQLLQRLEYMMVS